MKRKKKILYSDRLQLELLLLQLLLQRLFRPLLQCSRLKAYLNQAVGAAVVVLVRFPR